MYDNCWVHTDSWGLSHLGCEEGKGAIDIRGEKPHLNELGFGGRDRPISTYNWHFIRSCWVLLLWLIVMGQL